MTFAEQFERERTSNGLISQDEIYCTSITELNLFQLVPLERKLGSATLCISASTH